MKIADPRFLVAEDHDFQRQTLVRMLASLGARHIVEAVDGRAALGAIQKLAQPIDIIICDLETRADWELLKILDCDVAQGYLFARPMAATQIADWATAWGPPE